MDSVDWVILLLEGKHERKEKRKLSRNVISADGVAGQLPHNRGGVSLGVGGASMDLSRSGVGDGREDGTVPAKCLDLFPGVKRCRGMVAVSCEDRSDRDRRGDRSTKRRV
jgi:hypothetical protein